MENKKFNEAFQKVVMGYETADGKHIVQNLSNDKGNWVDGKNVGTAYGISGKTLNDVFFNRPHFADGTRNPYYHSIDPTGAQQHISAENVRAVTQDQARTIAFHDIWNPIDGNSLSDKIAPSVFDSAFHNGNEKAISHLQANLASANLYDGVISGKMNPATVAAMNKVDPSVLYNFYHDARVEAYQGSSSSYKDSFVNRVEQEFPKEALNAEQQAHYQGMSTLKSLQEYVNKELGDSSGKSIKADGIWGKETKNAIDQVGGHSVGHTISPELQQRYVNWLADQSNSGEKLNQPAASASPSIATHAIATSDLSASVPSVSSGTSVISTLIDSSASNQSSASIGAGRYEPGASDGSMSSSGGSAGSASQANSGSSSAGGI
ncbi:glycosyl hydrolase 108 family protein [Spirosoma panaciterrae]|uniref:glycosyl hydrolase 108 family protein n=1 Tax=Spirosoma panaciterrae TaxID=496058 RepID=UPI00035F73A6|nr:glycosyl hydrolase 108 family protein [Spirosoma panaciterrae]